MPSIKSQRAPSFGRGEKTSLLNLSTRPRFPIAEAPPPGCYNPTESIKKITANRAYSFGISREAYKKVFLKHHPTLDASIPGPGTYTSNEHIGKGGMKCSLKAKAKNLSQAPSTICLGFVETILTPGPCAYETIPSINPTGKFFYSKYKNSLARRFNPPQSKRFYSKVP